MTLLDFLDERIAAINPQSSGGGDAGEWHRHKRKTLARIAALKAQLPSVSRAPMGATGSVRVAFCCPFCGQRRENDLADAEVALGATARWCCCPPMERDGERLCRSCQKWLPLAAFRAHALATPAAKSRCGECTGRCRPRSRFAAAARQAREAVRALRRDEAVAPQRPQ